MADYTFIKTGNYYVHKNGSDSSYPTSASDPVDLATLQGKTSQCVNKTLANFLPKATVMAAVNAAPNGSVIMVKSGDYQETVAITNRNLTLDEDGAVTYRGTGTDAFGGFGDSASQTIICSLITDYAYISARGQIRNAVIQCPVAQGFNGSFTNCKFVGYSINSIDFTVFNYCTFVNNVMQHIGSLKNCDVGSGCTMELGVQTPAYYVKNNIRGTLSMPMAGNGSTGQGSTAGVQLSLADHQAEYPAYNVGSFNKPSLFNSVARLDFSYQSASPNYFGYADTAIGGVGVSRSMYLTDTYDTTAQPNPLSTGNGAQLVNLTQSGNDFVLIDTTQPGYIISAPIFNGATARPIGKINYIGKKTYNESAGGVYDTVPRVRRTDGSLAPAFSFFMRWTIANKPVNDAGYENGNSVAAGTYVPFLFGSTPQVDASGKGQGDKGFTLATANEVGATWYQLRIEISNLKA